MPSWKLSEYKIVWNNIREKNYFNLQLYSYLFTG